MTRLPTTLATLLLVLLCAAPALRADVSPLTLMTWSDPLTHFPRAYAHPDQFQDHLQDLAATDPARRAAAVQRFQGDIGPWALRQAFAVHAGAIDMALREPGWNPPEWQALSASLDQIAHQRNAYAAGLYWYTDLEQARAAAATADLPILSLQLLGNLQDELTCANSRFFRTVLYADQDLANYLRTHYILHWNNVRDVPVVTFDLGQGRQIRQTITGNSLHYVIDPTGYVVDVLPGVYDADTFQDRLGAAAAIMLDSRRSAVEPGQYYLNSLRSRALALQKAWIRDLETAGLPVDASLREAARQIDPARPTDAVRAAVPTVSKAMIERPMFRSVGLNTYEIEAAMTDDAWLKLAAARTAAFTLSANSRALIVRQFAGTPDAAPWQLEQQLDQIARNVPLETTKNDYLLRERMLQMLAAPRDGIRGGLAYQLAGAPGAQGGRGIVGAIETVGREIDAAAPQPRISTNAEVRVETAAAPAALPLPTLADSLQVVTHRFYAEVFRTPLDDPWMGLDHAELYSGLNHSGLITAH